MKSITISGDVPQETWGLIFDTSISISLSNIASLSVVKFFHFLIASFIKLASRFECFLTYSIVLSSTDTNPTLAPASIDILHIVILASIEIFRIYDPANSTAYPVPPAVPIVLIKYKIISFEDTPSCIDPSKFILIFLSFLTFKLWVARTCSTSDVPIPIARQPKAPWVEVCESPQTILIPGSVKPNSGPITWTMPWLFELILNCFIPKSLQFLSNSTTCNFEILSSMFSTLNSLPLVVGTLWSGVAMFALILHGLSDFFLRPSKAWGDVTSWRKCLSI